MGLLGGAARLWARQKAGVPLSPSSGEGRGGRGQGGDVRGRLPLPPSRLRSFSLGLSLSG